MDSTNIDSFVDETYLIALVNEEPLPISDEKYAHELSLQEALFSSSISNPSIHQKINSNFNELELGESSSSSEIKTLLCGICMEYKSPNEIFSELPNCSNHTYCNDCMARYVTSKIKENISLVECPYPKCGNKIEPQNCSTILPKEVFDRWENALCEALILECQKFYCPYKECSALMVDDAIETVRQAECPSCRKLFCARCHVPWHVGFTCEEFITFNEDDFMAIKLAKDKEWKRCSNCNFYVEKNEGCLHITCRCSYQFCYKCGTGWVSGHVC